MKITVNQLRRIIKEEIERVVSEEITYNPKVGKAEIGYDRALKSLDMVGDENPEKSLQQVAKMLGAGDPKQVSFTMGKVPQSGMSAAVLLAGKKDGGPTHFFDPMDTEWREIPEESFK